MNSNTTRHLDSLKNLDLDDSASDDIEWMDKWVIRFIKAAAITLAVLVVGGCFSVIVPLGKHALTYEKTPDSSTSRTTRTPAPPKVSGKSRQDGSGSSKDGGEFQQQQSSDEGAQKNHQSDNPDSQNPDNNSAPNRDYTEDLKSAGSEIGNDLKEAGEQAIDKGKQAGKSAGDWLRQKWNSAGESGQNGNSSNQNQDENEQSAETDEGSSEDKPAPQNDSSQNQ